MTPPPLPSKRVEASKIHLSQVIFPKDTNELGLATAGVVLKLIDITASLTASKHTGKKIVTASLDRMAFINPARRWELITTTCFLTKTWSSSMEIKVMVNAECMRSPERRRVAEGYLVFVALDDEHFRPSLIPSLQLDYPEEFELATAAEARKQTRLAEQALLSTHAETAIEADEFPETICRTMTPDDSNIHHNVFGGVILELIHQAGERAAMRQALGPVIAVLQDRMSFKQPACIGEEVRAQAVVTRTWKTSLEVQVDVVAKDHKTHEERSVASSYLVFVAQDISGHPKSVPPFTPTTPRQEHRWAEADVRRATRLQS